ncbi:hypothetical protein [Burkholderia sp. JKS000303]|uniref:hypothetical protein n=1 Tax=Burkholderia sp. JKS000303 TaxID=1938747 RepID=UPI00117E7A0F|nr:hypothetical protein [Burkholderia sp. JKS000303]
MNTSSFRDLSDLEVAILNRMASCGVPNEETLMAQISTARARQIDGEGSIQLITSSDRKYNDTTGPLITAVQADIDTVQNFGPYINFVLILKDGFIDELEIYKDDGGRIVFDFNPDDFSMTWGGPRSL